MDTINLDGFTDLQECLEKALPPVEGEVRKYKDGDYKFINGKWKKIKQEQKIGDNKEREIVNIEEISEQIKDFNAEQMEDLIGTWLARRYDPGPGAQLLRDMANRYDY
jgi:hypothetical protein